MKTKIPEIIFAHSTTKLSYKFKFMYCQVTKVSDFFQVMISIIIRKVFFANGGIKACCIHACPVFLHILTTSMCGSSLSYIVEDILLKRHNSRKIFTLTLTLIKNTYSWLLVTNAPWRDQAGFTQEFNLQNTSRWNHALSSLGNRPRSIKKLVHIHNVIKISHVLWIPFCRVR